MDRLRLLLEDLHMRARVALEGGPRLDIETVAAETRAALNALDELERERLWRSKRPADDGA